MSEPDSLRDQIARLRMLAPKLNDVTDHAAKLVQAVEKLLVDDLSIGMTCRVHIRSIVGDTGNPVIEYYLNFGRYQGKFRLFVSEEACYGAGNTEETLWAALPRDMKLESFQRLPDLLAALSKMVERAILETEGASKTITELVKAIGVPVSAPGYKVHTLKELMKDSRTTSNEESE